MREIRPSGSMSGEWKRSTVGYSGTGRRKGRTTRKATPKPPRHSSTLPVQHRAGADRFRRLPGRPVSATPNDAVGTRSFMGEGCQHRFQDDKRPLGDGRRETDVPPRVQAPRLLGSRLRVLRVADRRQEEAADAVQAVVGAVRLRRSVGDVEGRRLSPG